MRTFSMQVYLLLTVVLTVLVNERTHCQPQSMRTTPSPSKCISSDWIPYRDIKCLKVLNLFDTQSEGMRACQEQLVAFDLAEDPSTSTSSLLSISSKEEEIFVDHFLFNRSAIADNIWLSASRNPKSRDFTWSDGTLLTGSHTNWAFSNPTDTPSRTCVELRSPDNRIKNSWTADPGTWFSVPCSKHNLVVCQYLIRSLPSPQVMSQLTQVKKDVEDLQNKVSSLDEGQVSLEKVVGGSKDDIAKLKRVSVELQRQLDEGKAEIMKLKKVDEELQKQVDGSKMEISELKKEMEWVKVEIEELKRMMSVLLESVITDIRFGKVEIKDVYKGHGYEDGEGYVLTGAVNWDGDTDVDTLERRKVQKFINGKWYNVY